MTETVLAASMTDPRVAEREARFRDEVAAYRLRFRCAACAHVITDTRTCSMGYPNVALVGPLRAMEVMRTRPGTEVPAEAIGPVTCKYFELGESELDDPNL
ncbi:MAG: hypothetical protein JNJ59_12225 [Deltaproteobacteria bacterium]|nr:hypothetical protein [Deltaproteobacteria bacterium]